MSNVYPLNSEDHIMDQASDWIAKLDRGLNAEEKQAFQAWMAKSEKHQQILMEMAGMWDKMDSLNKLSEVFPHTPQQKSTVTRNFAIAASFVLACLISLAAWNNPDWSISGDVQQIVSENHYSTGVGEHSTFYLQDKTKVVLNTDSKLKVTYTDKQRLFELLQGELHVTVAHNASLPLSVHAGDRVIQAVGTAFNVELRDTEVELIVTDGKVLVAERDEAQQKPLELDNVRLPGSSLAVVKGEMVELGAPQQQIARIDTSEIEANLSWQQGNLIFRGESLEDAMWEVSRYTSYSFELADDALKQVQVAGLFKTGDVNGLLAALEENFNVKHQRIGTSTIRLRLADSAL